MITVKELVESLSSANPEAVVILSKDGEGNSFSPLAPDDFSEPTNRYHADSTWSGEVKLSSLTPELIAKGYSDEDVGSLEDGFIDCVVLWPTN